jgi:hypothetical protein
VPTTLDREIPYLYAHADTTLANHSGWKADVAMLWLTARTGTFEGASTAREPEVDVDVHGWND